MADLSELEGLLVTLRSGDHESRTQVAETIGEIGPAAIPDLIAALGDNDVRMWVAYALSQMGDEATTALITALNDKNNDDLRARAAFALWRIASPIALPDLLNVLNDGNLDVRVNAYLALGSIGDLSSLPVLLTGLRDPNDRVRQAASIALAWIGHPSTLPDFLDALTDEDRFVRDYALFGLSKVGDQTAIPRLVAALRDENSGVRYRASELLKKLGWLPANDEERASYLVAAVDWNGCIQLGTAAVPDLVWALRNERKWVHQVAEQGATDFMVANPYFLDAMTHGPAVLYDGMINALSEIGDPRAIPALVECLAYTERTHFWGGRICSLAAGALQMIGTPEALAALEGWEDVQPGA